MYNWEADDGTVPTRLRLIIEDILPDLIVTESVLYPPSPYDPDEAIVLSIVATLCRACSIERYNQRKKIEDLEQVIDFLKERLKDDK